jgi:hypothetical protein
LPTGPATKLLYSVAGRTVLINAYDQWSYLAVSQLFADWFLDPFPDRSIATPDMTLNIRCGVTSPPVPGDLRQFEITHGGNCFTDNQSYHLTFGNSRVVFGPGLNREVNLWVDQAYDIPSEIVTQLLSHALSPALRRANIFELHSAGVVPPGQKEAILLAGPSGSGKSTLTSQLARCGWGYLSDDILLLTEHEQKVAVQAFRRFFALTPETMSAAKLPRTADRSGRAKERVTPQEHFQAGPIQSARAATIVFPKITKTDRSRVNPLTAAESMQRLLRLCPWASYDTPTSAEHLRVLGLLANTTSAFELLTGADIVNDPNAAAEVISNAIGELACSS